MFATINPIISRNIIKKNVVSDARKSRIAPPLSYNVSFKGNPATALRLYSSEFIRKPFGVFIPAKTVQELKEQLIAMKNMAGERMLDISTMDGFIKDFTARGHKIEDLSTTARILSPYIAKKLGNDFAPKVFIVEGDFVKRGLAMRDVIPKLDQRIISRLSNEQIFHLLFAKYLSIDDVVANAKIVSGFADRTLDAIHPSVIYNMLVITKLHSQKDFSQVDLINLVKPSIIRKLSGRFDNNKLVDYPYIHELFAPARGDFKSLLPSVNFINSLDDHLIEHIGPGYLKDIMLLHPSQYPQNSKFLNQLDVAELEAMDKKYFSEIVDEENAEGAKQILRRDNRHGYSFMSIFTARFSDMSQLDKARREYRELYDMVAQHPQRFTTDNIISEDKAREVMSNVFEFNKADLFRALHVTDKETVQTMLSERKNKFLKYLMYLDTISAHTSILPRALKCTSVDGKPFTPAQKADIVKLLASVINVEKSTFSSKAIPEIEKMVDSGVFDTKKIKQMIGSKIYELAGVKPSKLKRMTADKLAWDEDFVHLIPLSIGQLPKRHFRNLIKMAVDYRGFISAITDSSNKYGANNALVLEQFDKFGIDRDKWFRPSPSINVILKLASKEYEDINSCAGEFLNKVGRLMRTPAKSFIIKHFPNNIYNGEFVLDKQLYSSQPALASFIKRFMTGMEDIWQRAQKNSLLPDSPKRDLALEVLTHKSALDVIFDKTVKIDPKAVISKMDLTLKNWDRIPQKDLFQGSFSKCCIALDGGNGFAMPEYLTNASFNMIELVNNATRKPIGNALVFFAKDSNGKPIFIIDNVEIAGSVEHSAKMNEKLRAAIFEYAKRFVKDVSPNSDLKIYIGSRNNEVPTADLKKVKMKVEFLGKMTSSHRYLDIYGGEGSSKTLNRKVTLCEIN